MNDFRRTAICSFLAIALAGYSQRSFAQGTHGEEAGQGSGAAESALVQEARTRFNRGIEFYNEGDYKLALIEFQRSYGLAPSWRLLYNIGSVYFQLNDYASALKAFEQYKKEGGTAIPSKRLAEVDRDIDALRARTAHLAVRVNVAGADVTIDDVPVGRSPLSTDLLVDAGTRRVSVSKTGYITVMKTVTVGGREQQNVTIELVESTTAPANAPQQKPESTSYSWVGWTATGALAGGAIAAGIISLNEKSNLDDLRDKRGVTRAELDDSSSRLKTFRVLADTLAVAAVLTGGVSLYFALRKPSSTPPSTDVRVGLGSVQLIKSF